MTELSLPDKVVALDHALDDAGIDHAFGGALALAYYAEPRSTVDIDVNVFVALDRAGDVIAALRPLGVHDALDPRALDRDGQVRLQWGRTPVDLFFAYDEVHDAMRRGRRVEPFGSDVIPVLSAEHLVLCKVIFDRDKDWLDVAQVLVAVDGFDVAEVRRWLARIIAADDPRRNRFDDLARELLGAGE
jgi:hypothetical protein